MSVVPSVPPFEHDQKLHDIVLVLNPKKVIRQGKMAVVFFLACAAIPYLVNGKGHPLLDPDAINMLFFACLGVAVVYSSSVMYKVARSETAPLYVRYDSHNSPQNLVYSAQIRHVFIVQIMLVSLGCLGIVMWNFPFQYPWIDAINPWFLHAHGHTRWATTCFVGYLALLLGLLLIVATPSCAIQFSADRVRITARYFFVHWTRKFLDRTWDELETIRFIQSSSLSYYILKTDSTAHYAALNAEHCGVQTATMPKPYVSNEKRFELPKTLIIDPCWLEYVARVMIQLPDAGSRQDFLDNLVNYAPPGTKVRYKK